MRRQEIESSLLLLLASAIWGLAFVAQRVSIGCIGAFTYNGVRFALGAVSLLPLVFLMDREKKTIVPVPREAAGKKIPVYAAGAVAGSILFCGASLQQVGLYWTTAGKAGFITDLYIVLVPLAGVFLRRRIRFFTWLGVAFCTAGLYFICVTQGFTVSRGDVLELFGSFFWTAHILVIGYLSNKTDVLKLSVCQYVTCSALSITVALFTEKITLEALMLAAAPILYGGILSVGVAYTLQVVGQKHARPSHAAIILSMESVFAFLGGALFLHEKTGPRGLAGCALMVAGMVVSQYSGAKNANNP